MEKLFKSPILSLLVAGGLLVLALSWVFSLPMNARYPDLVTERAYFEDTYGREDIRSIQTRDFVPFTGPLFHGNDARPLWLRLTLAPSANPDWVVMFQPNYTHAIEVWLPQPDGGWRRAVTGSRFAFSQREIDTLAPAVAVTPSAHHAVTVYARVSTPTTPIYARVLTRADNTNFDTLVSMAVSMFIGIGLIMSLLSFLVYVSTRDGIWGLDALFNLSGLILLVMQMGLVSRLVFPDNVDLVNQLCLIVNCAYVTIAALLYMTLFRLFDLPRLAFLPYWLALATLPVLLWLIARGNGGQAMMLNNLIIALLTLWGVFIVFRARHPDPFIRRVFRVAYAGLLVYMLIQTLSITLRVQSGSMAALYPSMPVSLFTMLMLMLILGRNTQLKWQAAQRMALEKAEAEQRLRFEQLRHEETNSFLGMLLHEVKNPLSTIRMTVSNLETELTGQGESVRRRLQRVHQSVDDVDDVLERGVEIDSLEQGALALEPAAVNVAALVADFRQGHAGADRIRLDSPAALVACVDSHLISLMLRNLIDNALKYSPEGSPVTLSLSADDTRWQLEVRNLVGTVGFPDADRVFSKYYRSELAMRRIGMGLGLYWVRGVARRMGGEVYYARDQDDVVFRLCLPI